MLSFQPLGHRANGAYLHPVGLLTQAQYLIDDGGRVLCGRGVRHGMNGRVAADRSSASTGENSLGILATGLTQVGMDVNEAGQSDEPRGVDHARIAHTVAGICANGDDRATRERNVGGFPAEKRCAGDQDVAGLFSHCCVLPKRGAGTERPCGRTRRWTPVRR